MKQQVELFYDFRSPYGYLAFAQLRELDIDLVLRPMQILKVMELVGNVPTTIICKAKGQYARTDLGRWARRYGIACRPWNRCIRSTTLRARRLSGRDAGA